jgi:hypothetical protein
VGWLIWFVQSSRREYGPKVKVPFPSMAYQTFFDGAHVGFAFVDPMRNAAIHCNLQCSMGVMIIRRFYVDRNSASRIRWRCTLLTAFPLARHASKRDIKSTSNECLAKKLKNGQNGLTMAPRQNQPCAFVKDKSRTID